jgi:thiol:disulfide interchange protein DsbD
MKKPFFFLAFALICSAASAQIQSHIKWTCTYATPPKAGAANELIFKAVIDPKWHLYSTDQNPDVGPIPLSLKFTSNASYKLVGNIKAIKPIKKQDEIFGGEVRFFEGKAEFRQSIQVLKASPVVEGFYAGQSCQDDGVCVQERGKFSFATAK